MKCLFCRCQPRKLRIYPSLILPSPKGFFSLFPSFLLLVKKSKDVHSIKIRRVPITDVIMVRLVKFKCWQLFFKANNTESSAAKSALDYWVRRLLISWAEAHERFIPTLDTLSKPKLSWNLQCLFCPTLWPLCFLHGFTQFVLYIHKNSHWLQ